MNWFRLLTLKTKLNLIIAVVSGVTLILSLSLLCVYDFVTSRRALADDFSATASVISGNLTAAVAFEDVVSAREILIPLSNLEHLQYAVVHRYDGSELTRFIPGSTPAPGPTALSAGHRFVGRKLVVVRPIELDGETIGHLQVATSLDPLYERSRNYVGATLLILAGVMALILLVTPRLQKLITLPILKLAHVARDISTNRDYSLRVVTESSDEIGILTESFNEMLVEIQSRDDALNRAYREVELRVDELQGEIAERKRAEEALEESEERLRQSQKMEAVGQLAGGVAHDFNNLLTAINGYASLALKQMDPSDPIVPYIREISESGERASGLTRQLLAFSRKQVLEPTLLDLNEILVGMEKMLGRLIGEDIELRTLPGTDLAPVTVDRGQIEQVLLNLSVNSRDAMRGGGQLSIETRNVALDDTYPEVPPGDYVLLAVSDTGGGMDETTRERIFEPFFTTKEMGKGTGLGLSTVYGIVKQSNGHITVYSEIGQGTTFKIYLPADEMVAEAPRDTVAPQLHRGSETILLVEDEDQVLRLTREILTMNGYRVIEAAHPGEAILVCEEKQTGIDLVLTDVVMPQMNGRELYERLAADQPGLAVVFMSGYTDGAIEQHGILEEGTLFLQKPFTPEALTEIVRRALDRRLAA